MEVFFEDFLLPIIIVGMVVLAPIWIAFHYISKWKAGNAANVPPQAQNEQIAALHRKSVQMRERVEALEAILDAEIPGWRDKL